MLVVSPDVRSPAPRQIWLYSRSHDDVRYQSKFPSSRLLGYKIPAPRGHRVTQQTLPHLLSTSLLTHSMHPQYKSWTSHSRSSSAPSYPTSSPGPMPSAPHLRTVSLPHPNSAPHHASSSSGCMSYPTSFHMVVLTSLPDQTSSAGPSSIVSLNPILSWTGTPPLYYNITRDVQCIQLRPGCPPNLLQEPAVHPARTVLVLSIPSLPPWSMIEVRNEHGVSAYDVLARIRDVLNRSVSAAEMGAMVSISAVASEYFRVRTQTDPREFAQGVKRIDFLGPNVFFAGLSPSRDGQGRWEVHFVPMA